MIGNHLKRLESLAAIASVSRCAACGGGTHPFARIQRFRCGQRSAELEPRPDWPSPYDDSGRCRRCGQEAKYPVTLVRPAPR